MGSKGEDHASPLEDPEDDNNVAFINRAHSGSRSMWAFRVTSDEMRIGIGV